VYQELIVYEWPWSQICMECGNSDFIQGADNFQNSCYVCNAKCRDNNGSICPMRKDKDSE